MADHNVQQDTINYTTLELEKCSIEKDVAEFMEELKKKYILMLRMIIQTERKTEKRCCCCTPRGR